MKSIKKLWPLLLMVTVLSACTKTTTIRRNKDFQNHLSQVKQFVLLPAAVNVVTVEASGKTVRNYDYESQIEDVIIDVIKPMLTDMGYKSVVLTRREIHNNKLSRSVLSFREEYDTKIASLYSKPLWEEEKAHNVDLFLDRKADDIAKLTESELVVFVEYALRAKTSGACTAQFAKSMLSAALVGAAASNPEEDAAEVVSLRLAIIDAKSGQFVWSNSTKTLYGVFSSMFSGKKNNQDIEAERLKELFKVLLQDLPAKSKLGV